MPDLSQALPRPTEADCGEYWTTYTQQVTADDVLSSLRQSAERMEAWFQGVDETKASTPYAPDKWSPKELLGHMLDTDRMFGTRTMAISRGETQALFGFDQDVYVAGGSFNDRSVANLLDEYRGLRASHLALFSSLQPEQATRRGNASGDDFTARAFPWIMAGHEIHHLKVLEERY